MINGKKLIYLGGPYSHEDPKVIKKRFNIFNKVSSTLICKKDMFVFSPISHSHPIVTLKNFDKNFWTYGYWMPFDLYILAQCDELLIVDIDGWKESKGLAAEIEFAKANNIKIRMVTPRGKIYKYEE